MLKAMFRCDLCGILVGPGVSCKKIATGKRVRRYPERLADPKRKTVIHRPIPYLDEKGKKKYRYPSDPGGVGWELVSEAAACPKCAAANERRERALSTC